MNVVQTISLGSATDGTAWLLGRVRASLPERPFITAQPVATPPTIAAVTTVAPKMPCEAIILANLCGHGDKDIFTVAEALGVGL